MPDLPDELIKIYVLAMPWDKGHKLHLIEALKKERGDNLLIASGFKVVGD